ncbi:DUF262 domain-containing protein [Rubrimonas cliftonensis]|uniref:GmrSD restriction endonucleases N-terminal domain-containing protein n=1 Tax=Rubrimonas cliftonensis TaxID=89524 RepID=A0A1H3Z1R2_9RHOB|nr:DUF262 domain-containing protein [Rubrimonas cliftonensis]SEA17264.1 hypothetical protein SAMN05444370_103332 [Rubrimonas cliftonensis]
MEARNRTIEEWFGWVREGRVVLPRFQRFEAWGGSQIEGILENILRKPALPVGALLILEVGDTPPFHARPIAGAPEPTVTPSYHLLDGQQRLTALWRSLTGDYEDVSFFVEIGEVREPDVTAIRRFRNKGERYPRWCDDPAEVWARGLMPVTVLMPGDAGAQNLKTWAKTAACDDVEALLRISEVGAELRARVAGFSIPFLSLPLGTDRDAALDVFIKMNTMNTALSAFDIVVAQVEAAIDQSLHELVEGLRAAVPELADFGQPGEIAMQVGAVLSGKAPNRATYLAPDFGRDLIRLWPDVERGLRRAIDFLAEERIFTGGLLPADPLLTLLAAFWASAPEGKDAEGLARRLARRIFWTGAFSDRYQKTSATRTDLDYRQLCAFRDAGGPTPDLLDPNLTPLPEIAELQTGGWPKTKDRLGRAIMAASLRIGGYDFADEAAFAKSNFARREYHHLFPRARLETEGRPRRLIYSALNCALVSWRTNRTIGDKPPSVYIAERAEEVGVEPQEVARRLRSHAIPPAALQADDFDAFLSARAAAVHAVMRGLCAGEVVSPEALRSEAA